METKKQRANTRRIETSKKILIYCDIMTTTSTIAAFIVALTGVEMTGLAEIVVALIGLSAAAHSLYYYKAKCENMAKYGQQDKITMSGEDNSLWGG